MSQDSQDYIKLQQSPDTTADTDNIQDTYKNEFLHDTYVVAADSVADEDWLLHNLTGVNESIPASEQGQYTGGANGYVSSMDTGLTLDPDIAIDSIDPTVIYPQPSRRKTSDGQKVRELSMSPESLRRCGEYDLPYAGAAPGSPGNVRYMMHRNEDFGAYDPNLRPYYIAEGATFDNTPISPPPVIGSQSSDNMTMTSPAESSSMISYNRTSSQATVSPVKSPHTPRRTKPNDTESVSGGSMFTASTKGTEPSPLQERPQKRKYTRKNSTLSRSSVRTSQSSNRGSGSTVTTKKRARVSTPRKKQKLTPHIRPDDDNDNEEEDPFTEPKRVLHLHPPAPQFLSRAKDQYNEIFRREQSCQHQHLMCFLLAQPEYADKTRTTCSLEATDLWKTKISQYEESLRLRRYVSYPYKPFNSQINLRTRLQETMGMILFHQNPPHDLLPSLTTYSDEQRCTIYDSSLYLEMYKWETEFMLQLTRECDRLRTEMIRKTGIRDVVKNGFLVDLVGMCNFRIDDGVDGQELDQVRDEVEDGKEKEENMKSEGRDDEQNDEKEEDCEYDIDN